MSKLLEITLFFSNVYNFLARSIIKKLNHNHDFSFFFTKIIRAPCPPALSSRKFEFRYLFFSFNLMLKGDCQIKILVEDWSEVLKRMSKTSKKLKALSKVYIFAVWKYPVTRWRLWNLSTNVMYAIRRTLFCKY